MSGIQQVGVTQVQSIERASIDAQIATAQQYPKHRTKADLEQIKAKMLDFATLDEATAAQCFYALPRGGKTITGPSVRMAEIAISCYGNIRDSVRTLEVVPDGPTPHVVVQGVCHDLETNVAVSMEKRRRITKKRNAQTVDEDDINLAVNSCAAIAFRDAAWKVIPQALVKPIVDAAMKVARGDLKSLASKRTQVIERLTKMGATTERILDAVGCSSVEEVGFEHVEALIGLGTALKDGEITLEDAFPVLIDETKSVAERIKERFDKPKKEKAAAEDKPDETKKSKQTKKGKKNKKDKAPAKEEAAKPEPEPAPSDDPDDKVSEATRWTCSRCKRILSEIRNDACPYCLGEVTPNG